MPQLPPCGRLRGLESRQAGAGSRVSGVGAERRKFSAGQCAEPLPGGERPGGGMRESVTVSQEFVVLFAAAVGAEAEVGGFGEIVDRADLSPAFVDGFGQAG